MRCSNERRDGVARMQPRARGCVSRLSRAMLPSLITQSVGRALPLGHGFAAYVARQHHLHFKRVEYAGVGRDQKQEATLRSRPSRCSRRSSTPRALPRIGSEGPRPRARPRALRVVVLAALVSRRAAFFVFGLAWMRVCVPSLPPSAYLCDCRPRQLHRSRTQHNSTHEPSRPSERTAATTASCSRFFQQFPRARRCRQVWAAP